VHEGILRPAERRQAFAALRQTGLQTLCVGGGVAANARIRQRLQEEAGRVKVEIDLVVFDLAQAAAVEVVDDELDLREPGKGGGVEASGRPAGGRNQGRPR
jgi:hypothetical protein